VVVGRVPADQPDRRGSTVHQVIWEHRFASHACPSPSPAYGRLYWPPNGEGVIYCFENANHPQPPCPRSIERQAF
jgi:hypothetical protein